MGEVHDENAYCLGGVAAHAGLFGTAAGVYHLLAHLFRSYRDKPADTLISFDVLKTFWRRQKIDRQSTWALGFDTPSAVNSNAATAMINNPSNNIRIISLAIPRSNIPATIPMAASGSMLMHSSLQLVLILLAVAVLALGVYPAPLLDVMRPTIEQLVQQMMVTKV